MNIFITGVCGFVGSELALYLAEHAGNVRIAGIDNFIRPGSETTRPRLQEAGVAVRHGDVRCASDLESVGGMDWVIDAAAQPSVRVGVDGRTSSRQAVEHNLAGTLNILEFCKARGAGLVLLSTSRAYSVASLNALPLVVRDHAFAPDESGHWPPGASAAGLTEAFSTTPPVSLYGATKIASEVMAIEYGDAFGLPVVVNRCGVLAGGAQFGTPEQGIFSYWIRAWAAGRALTYFGFDGTGHQVRDALHPVDLARLVDRQMLAAADGAGIWNVGGGATNAMSLAQLSDWCEKRFGRRDVRANPARRKWDVPWVVMDSSQAARRFGWTPTISIANILEEIARHHSIHPEWLAISHPL